MVTQAAENPEFPESSERETGAEEGAAFDAAVSEFLAYPPSLKLRRTSLQGYRQLAQSFVERVLGVDGRGVWH